MKKLILTLAVSALLVTSAQAGILVNDGNIDLDPVYFGVNSDETFTDSIFFETLEDGKTKAVIRTRRDGLNTPEYFNWMETHERTAFDATYDGKSAEFVDGKVRIYTGWMFQDGISECIGSFRLMQNELGIKQQGYPNNRGIRTSASGVIPQNLKCTGSSVGIQDYNGEIWLSIVLFFSPERRSEAVDLILAVNSIRELSSNEGAFDSALVSSDDPVIPDKLFSSN